MEEDWGQFWRQIIKIKQLLYKAFTTGKVECFVNVKNFCTPKPEIGRLSQKKIGYGMANKHSSKDKHKKKHKEKSKKHKKEKKYKKHKKEKSKYKSESSDSDSSDSDQSLNEKVREEPLKRSEWGFLDAALSDSNVRIKEKTEKVKRPSPERPGQNIRELNPYWKDGGCGVPPAKEKSKEEESTSSRKFLKPNSYSREYSSEGSRGHNRNDFGYDKPSRPNFLRPGEDSNFKPNSNTFQRNWKKKEVKELERQEVDVKPEVYKSEEKASSSSSSKKLSNEELNKLASKLVKAEIMGNTSLVNKLKAELEAAKAAKGDAENDNSKGKTKEVVIVTDRGVKKSHDGKHSHGPSKRQKVNTHDATGRVCYFPDDDKYSLKNLFEKEKGDREEEILLPSKAAGRNPDELDDVYLEAAASNKMQEKMEERKNKRAMKEAVIKHKTLEGCRWCLDNRNDTKHLIVSTGSKCYLCLPEEESLNKGHCLIVPLQHEISAMHLDEDVWSEIKTYQRVLTQMFLQEEQDVVFFENARSFKHFPHCVIHCVPLDKEMGDVAPIYFQKAISESESEWSTNKKVIDFRRKDLRRSIPKGLPYFAVSFGTEGGFAHVIEDEYLFKKNFAEEVLGGMLDLDPRKWRKPQKENFRTQREKALEFMKIWKKFEFNENSSDSESSSSD